MERSASRRAAPAVAAFRSSRCFATSSSSTSSSLGETHGLVFGSTASCPFTPNSGSERALTAWRRAGLKPIGLHECRHTFASLLIAAGVNAKAITAYLGHASIQTTFDLYGHLMPGNENEAVALVDAYLERADTGHRFTELEAGD